MALIARDPPRRTPKPKASRCGLSMAQPGVEGKGPGARPAVADGPPSPTERPAVADPGPRCPSAGRVRVAEQARTRRYATRFSGCRVLPRAQRADPEVQRPQPVQDTPKKRHSSASEWMDGITGRDKTPNPSAGDVLTLARTLAGLQQAPVLPDRLPLLLSEVHGGVAAFPSLSAEDAAVVPRHPDPVGYFCRISHRRDGGRLRS